MSVFRSRGFDSLIGKGTSIYGDISIAPNSTLQVDGEVHAASIGHLSTVEALSSSPKVSAKTTLRVVGKVQPAGAATPLLINVHNVVISGVVTCDELRVEGTLAIKSGAQLKATRIYYRELVIETGAVVHGQMFHLDHVSEGEQV